MVNALHNFHPPLRFLLPGAEHNKLHRDTEKSQGVKKKEWVAQSLPYLTSSHTPFIAMKKKETNKYWYYHHWKDIFNILLAHSMDIFELFFQYSGKVTS